MGPPAAMSPPAVSSLLAPPIIPSGVEREEGNILHGLSPVFRNTLASTMGASVVATTVTPLDVVKIRLQTHVCAVATGGACQDPLHVEGSVDAMRKIVRTDGIRGLWRGLNVTLLLAIPTTGLYFTLYEALRERLARTEIDLSPAASAVICGAAARIASTTASSPLELARTTLQAGGAAHGTQATVASVLRDVRQAHGVRAWWRGLVPTILRDAPFSAIYWGAYETLKDPARSVFPRRLFRDGNEFGVYLAAGIGAGGLAALCTVPPDVLKTRRQAMLTPQSSFGGVVQPVTSMQIARDIVATEGVRGLFRGAGPRVAKVAPACAIMMTSFEFFRVLLGGRD